MTELGELESHFQEFKNRKNPVNIVAISMDHCEDAQKSQAQFPHLTVVADTDRQMSHTLNVMHPGAGPGGEDAVAPTTILVDGQGTGRQAPQIALDGFGGWIEQTPGRLATRGKLPERETGGEGRDPVS